MSDTKEVSRFITTTIIPAEVAARMTHAHWLMIDFMVQDALRLFEPNIEKFQPVVYTRPAGGGE